MESGHHEHDHHHGMHSGTFLGHIGPGSSFIMFGCLWTYNALFRYHTARRQAVLKGYEDRKLHYKNSLFSKYYSGRAQVAPVEAIAVVSVVIMLCIGETITYILGHPATMTIHHLLMYFFFGVMGGVKVLQHRKYTIPPPSEYVAFIVANAATAFLLSNHLFGRAVVNGRMHIILVYLCALQIICVGVEIIYKRSVTAALGRALMFIAQGIWLCMMAFIIHPLPFMHKFDLDNHVLLDIVSSLAVLVVVIAILVAFTMNFVVIKRVRGMNLATVNRIVALTYQQRNSKSTKDEAASPLISDSDYDM